LVALQFNSALSDEVRKAMSLSGQYNGECDDANGFVQLAVSEIDRVVIRVSEGKWHGVDLPTNVLKVLPKLRAPLSCKAEKNVARGCIALLLLQLQPKEARLTGMQAAYSYIPKLMKRPCSYELAFALTDYKLQGMTLRPPSERHSCAEVPVRRRDVRGVRLALWRQIHPPGTSAPGGERRFEQMVS
jgi:hypothetical protein